MSVCLWYLRVLMIISLGDSPAISCCMASNGGEISMAKYPKDHIGGNKLSVKRHGPTSCHQLPPTTFIW